MSAAELSLNAEGTTRPALSLVPMSDADRRMRAVLRLPATVDRGAVVGAQSAMRTSLLISAVRCLLMYIVLPFVAPAVVHASGAVGMAVAVVDVVAIACIVASIRRFFAALDRRRWQYTAFAVCVLGFLAVSVAADLTRALG